MANEYPFIKRCSKHENDHEFHCSIRNVNFSCTHGDVSAVKDHVQKQPPEVFCKKRCS